MENKSLSMKSYVPNSSKVHVVDRMFQTRETVIYIIEDHLVMVQNRMKQQVDQHIFKCSFVKEDQVFLRLQPYK
jgi:hypothetical protein